jgi:hypothetical protein
LEHEDVNKDEMIRNFLPRIPIRMNSVRMNRELVEPTSENYCKRFDWREDLARSRDLTRREVEAYGYVLGWIESWRITRNLPAGRATAKRWWLEVAITKERPEWQLRQWSEAIVWFLGWLKICETAGGDTRTLAERVKKAVHSAGARRGLALKTRQAYAGWVARFGNFAGSAKRVMDETVGRDFLVLGRQGSRNDPAKLSQRVDDRKNPGGACFMGGGSDGGRARGGTS